MRVMHKTLPYIMATALTTGVAVKSINAENSLMSKQEQKIEQVKQTDESYYDKKYLPWLDIIDGTLILTFLGILKIANYTEKKEKQEEAKKQNIESK